MYSLRIYQHLTRETTSFLPVIVLQPDIIIVLIVCNLLLVPKSPNFTLPLLSRNILTPDKGDNKFLTCNCFTARHHCNLLLVPKSPNLTLPLLSRNILTPSKGDNQHLPVIVLQPDIIIVLIVCNLLLVPKSPNFTLPLLSRNILAPGKKIHVRPTLECVSSYCPARQEWQWRHVLYTKLSGT